MSTRCPTCGKPADPALDAEGRPLNRHYPFCSDRCKLIDLGRWLEGRYQIPVVEDEGEQGTKG